MVKINVKWGTKLFEGVEVDPSTLGAELKQQLQSLTEVPAQKQKILGFHGGVLRDDKTMADVGLREGMRIMVVGCAESSCSSNTTAASCRDSAANPPEKPVFLEDLSPRDKARVGGAVLGHPTPAGVVNLGNTCYMNAVLQLVARADKAVDVIKGIQITENSDDVDDRFLGALKKFYVDREQEKGKSISPFNLISAVRLRWPQFATQTRNGEGYAQQDAEEFLSAMLQALCERSSTFENLFGFDTEEKLICKEGGDSNVRTERNRILSCFTTGVKPVDHMMQGIQLSLDEEVEKHCDSLGKNAIFNRITRLNSLPEYLLVKFVRFEWKAANTFSRTESSKTKVCRRIQYPMEFDVYEVASDSLKKELEIPRYAWSVCGDPAFKRARLMDEGEEDGQAEDIASLCAGHYELVASVSHKGRSADSGHYVGWAQKDNDKEMWYKYDDDRVSEVRIRDIDMCGGRSDFHISVVLLYRRRSFDATAAQVARAVEEASAVSGNSKNP